MPVIFGPWPHMETRACLAKLNSAISADSAIVGFFSSVIHSWNVESLRWASSIMKGHTSLFRFWSEKLFSFYWNADILLSQTFLTENIYHWTLLWGGITINTKYGPFCLRLLPHVSYQSGLDIHSAFATSLFACLKRLIIRRPFVLFVCRLRLLMKSAPQQGSAVFVTF